jgi:tetratricopeptide (TPR) repeat protein
MVEASPAGDARRILPVAAVALLLLASAWWDSAFDLRYWALLTILVLALLVAQLLAGGWRLPSRGPLAISLAAIWCFAGYVLLSASWAESPALALEEAARSVFYAALWTFAVGTAAGPRWRARVAWGVVAGVCLVGLVTVVGMLGDGEDLFLAGRLDWPVGYRNGTAAFFAFAAWPLLGAAARRGVASGARAAAFAAAVLVLGLAFLTQSRGVLIGLALGGVVSLAIGPDRLRRAWLALAATAAVAIASGPLLGPYQAFDGGAGVASADDIRTAVIALILLTVASALVAAFVFVFDNGLRSEALDQRMRIVGSVSLVVVAVGTGVVGLAKVGDPVDYADAKIEEFSDVEPAAPTGATRLGSVGGQRSDLWRVALDEFGEHPILGGGAESYRFAYYEERRTDRNLSDAHGLPLRLLADLGLLGTGLFAIWLLAAAAAIVRRARSASPSERLWLAGLSAAGVTVLAQCLTDWLWLLPGLLGLAVLALGLAAGDEAVAEPVTLRAWSRARATAAAGLAAVAIGVGFLFFADLYVRKARVEAPRSPGAALSAARTAAWFNPVAVSPLYLEASALESEGRRAKAREALEEAREQEPRNFVTLGLLGDLETRGGDEREARRRYREALALNPLDVGLRKLSEGSE